MKGPRTFAEPSAPDADTDSTQTSVQVGDIWVDTSTNDVYICAASTPGAAVWKKVNNA